MKMAAIHSLFVIGLVFFVWAVDAAHRRKYVIAVAFALIGASFITLSIYQYLQR